MTFGTILLYIGIAVMGLAILGAAAAIIVFRRSGRILKAKLETEYGEKRR